MVRGGLTILSTCLTALIVQDIQRTLATPSLDSTPIANHTFVSVLIPARNEAQRIGRLLEG